MLFPKYYTTYLITITQRHGHILSILRHLRYQWPWTSLRGHPKSLTLAPIKSAYGTSYWTSIVTLVISYRVSDILQLLYAKSFFPAPHLYSGQTFGCSPGSKCKERTSQANYPWNYFRRIPHVITIPQRYRQTDRQADR